MYLVAEQIFVQLPEFGELIIIYKDFDEKN